MSFIQIHALTSYHPSLLNRDYDGFAKRIPYGGKQRTRISSQCLKRHWRHAQGESTLTTLGADLSVRSRISFQKYIIEPLVAEGLEEEKVVEMTLALMGLALGESKKAKKAAEDKGPSVKTSQITILGKVELNYFKGLVQSAVSDGQSSKDAAAEWKKTLKANLAGLKQGAGLDAALFGRMVTSDYLARVDSCVQVAHAFTVHAQETEQDYFSAIDDLLAEGDGEKGAGYIDSSELTTGLFYSYTAIDVKGLLANLAGDIDLAKGVVEGLIKTIATVSPGAKKGSTAPFNYASMMMVEVGEAQPCSHAEAFLKPVRSRDGGWLEPAYDALANHLKDLAQMYPAHQPKRRIAGRGLNDALGALMDAKGSLPEVAKWAAESVG